MTEEAKLTLRSLASEVSGSSPSHQVQRRVGRGRGGEEVRTGGWEEREVKKGVDARKASALVSICGIRSIQVSILLKGRLSGSRHQRPDERYKAGDDASHGGDASPLTPPVMDTRMG